MSVGVEAYKVPEGMPPDTVLVDIGGRPFLFSASLGVVLNMQSVSEKFAGWPTLHAELKTKGVTTWLKQ